MRTRVKSLEMKDDNQKTAAKVGGLENTFDNKCNHRKKWDI